MGRIMAVDYGKKRTGLAVTDELRIIAGALATVPTKEIMDYLRKYAAANKVDIIVVGEPRQMDNSPSEYAAQTDKFVERLKSIFPDISVERVDERFTSKMAFQTMIDAGLGKKDRQNKALVDSISATIILQSYLELISRK